MRRRKWLRALGIVFAIIAASSVAAWYFLSGTPEYSLYQLSRAIQAKDAEAAQRYIDLDRVADEATDTVIDFARSKTSVGRPQLAQGLIELLLPALKAGVRDKFRTQLRETVEGGRTESRFLSIPAQLADFRTRVRVERTGKSVVVSITKGTEVVSKFRMVHKLDRHWQIVALDREWLLTIIRETDLPEASSPAPPPTTNYLITVKQVQYEPGIFKVIGAVTNDGDYPDETPTVTLRVYADGGQTLVAKDRAWPAGAPLGRMQPGDTSAFQATALVPEGTGAIYWGLTIENRDCSAKFLRKQDSQGYMGANCRTMR